MGICQNTPNAMITLFSPRWTPIGGFVSVSQERNKLKPLARWFQYRLMWLCGMGEKVFCKKL
jgi:hypothetical protein